MTNKQKVLSDDSTSTTCTPPIDCKGGIRKLKKEINNTNFRQNYFELRVGEQKIRHETKLKDLDESTKDRLKFMSIIKVSQSKKKKQKSTTSPPQYSTFQSGISSTSEPTPLIFDQNNTTSFSLSPPTQKSQAIVSFKSSSLSTNNNLQTNSLSFPHMSNLHHQFTTNTFMNDDFTNSTSNNTFNTSSGVNNHQMIPTVLHNTVNSNPNSPMSQSTTTTSTLQSLSLDGFSTNEEITPNGNCNRLPNKGEQDCKIECFQGELKISMSDSFINFLQSIRVNQHCQLTTNSTQFTETIPLDNVSNCDSWANFTAIDSYGLERF